MSNHWVKSGKCPQCGAPIYTDNNTIGMPEGPEIKYTCECRNKVQGPHWSYTENNLPIAGSGTPGTNTWAVGAQTVSGAPITDNTIRANTDPRELLQEEKK